MTNMKKDQTLLTLDYRRLSDAVVVGEHDDRDGHEDGEDGPELVSIPLEVLVQLTRAQLQPGSVSRRYDHTVEKNS